MHTNSSKPPHIRVPTMTLREAAELTGFCELTLRRYIAEGTLPAYRAGRRIRLHPEDVAALFQPVVPIPVRGTRSRIRATER